MNIACRNAGQPFRLKFQGAMTFECRQALEGMIIDAMRRHKTLEADLSEVSAIDFYGIHLLAFLHSIGEVIAISPVVEAAARQLPQLKPIQNRALRHRVSGEG